MNKDCCDIKVAEVKNGYRIEITGDKVKEKCGSFLENCCTEDNFRKCLEGCCGGKK